MITRMDVVGGAQNHVRDLAIGLKSKGHAITIISGENENIHQSIGTAEIQCFHSKYLKRALHPWKDFKAFFEIRKELKRIQPNLIATHSAKAGIIGRVAGWSLGIPTVFTAHGWSFTEGIPKKKRFFYKNIERAVNTATSGIITVSKYDLQLAKDNKVAPSEKIYTIHNGVHNLPAIPRVKQETTVLKFTMVARFAKPKRQLEVVKALEKFDQSTWQLTFAGDGPLQQEVARYVEKHKLTESVLFLGNERNIEGLLAHSDVFILLSDWEGFPLSILEAMRSGLPIIASDVGGVSESVQHGENGFLIKRNDAEQLHQMIKALLENQGLRIEMGKASRRNFERQFTFEQMLTKTDAYYKKIIEKKGVLPLSKEEWLDESVN